MVLSSEKQMLLRQLIYLRQLQKQDKKSRQSNNIDHSFIFYEPFNDFMLFFFMQHQQFRFYNKIMKKIGWYLRSSNLRQGNRWFSQQQKQTPGNTGITEEKAQSLINKWVKNNKICLFMKGNPDSPKCGYSKLMVQILKFYELEKYKYIDVTEDPFIREQIKLYSKWPTFPQLFVDGELIGGSDVVNQMHHDDSLQKLLEEKQIIPKSK